jgi:hypothetical protein
LQSLKGNKQRTRVNAENAVAHLFDPDGDAISMGGFKRHGFQDKHVQGALDEISRLAGHDGAPLEDQEENTLLLLIVKRNIGPQPTEREEHLIWRDESEMPSREDEMLSDTFVSFGSHAMRLSSLLLLIGGVLLFGMAAFLVGVIRGRRVLVQRSATTDELNAQLGRIAEALERIVNRPADHAIAEASRAAEVTPETNVGAQQRSIPYSMFGR